MNTKKAPNLGLLILILLVALCVYYVVNAAQGTGLYYSQIVEQFENENVRAFEAGDGKIILSFYEPVSGQTAITCRTDLSLLQSQLGDLFMEQAEKGILTYTFLPDSTPTVFTKALPYLIAGLILLVFWVLLAGRMGAGGGANPGAQFGKARTFMGQSGK